MIRNYVDHQILKENHHCTNGVDCFVCYFLLEFVVESYGLLSEMCIDLGDLCVLLPMECAYGNCLKCKNSVIHGLIVDENKQQIIRILTKKIFNLAMAYKEYC